MLARRPLEVFVVVACIAEGFCTDGQPKVWSPQEVTPASAEIILGAQTTLRRYFIESLANLQESIIGLKPFYSVVNGILQGLRSRELDPLKSYRNGYKLDNNQSVAYQMATAIHSMQGCSSAQITLADWHSFLRTIPRINHIVPPPPNILHLTPHHLHQPNASDFPFAVLLLHKIQQNHLKPNRRLIGDVLYNYPFRNYSPDLDVALNNIIRMIGTSRTPLDTFRPNPASALAPNEILSDILNFLLRQQHSHSHAWLPFETGQLLSALSNSENVENLRGASNPWELLELIRNDDYPPDVVRAAIHLASALRNKQVKVVGESLKGYSPLEKLLRLICQLAGIPRGDPLSGMVHGIYPHVKLRYLSSKERFFHPHTSSDVAFLLNSFLTVPSRLLIGEVHKVFLLPDFNWKTVLEKFDYSRYSKPRTLLTDMLEELLRNSDRLPARELVLLTYFLRNYSQVPACSPYEFNDDMVSEKLGGPVVPLSVFPDVEEMMPSTTPEGTTDTQCSDGPPVELVDPDSIIEILNSNHRTAFISDLIRFNPMPAGRYPNKTRLAIYRTVMNNLKSGKYNHSSTAFVIQQALMKIPLNEKANFPPRYLHLCPFEVAAMEDNAPAELFHHPKADSATVTASTTASFSPFSASVSTRVPPSFRLSSSSPPLTASPSTNIASSEPFSPALAADTTFPVTTMLPPVTTAPLTIVSANATSDTTSSFFSSPPPVSHPPHLPPTTPSMSSPFPPTPSSTAQPPFTANSNPLLQLPTTASFSQRRLPVHTTPQQFPSAFFDSPESTPTPRQPLHVDPSQSSLPRKTTPWESMQQQTVLSGGHAPVQGKDGKVRKDLVWVIGEDDLEGG